MANSKFWRHMAARFSALQDPHLLTAEWSLDSFSVDAWKEIWKIRCDRTANVLKLSFEELARQSAIEACADIGAGDSLDSWLALLKLETRTFESKPIVYLWKQHPPDLRPYMANLAQSGVIHEPSRVSAAYCLRLETRARQAEKGAQTQEQAPNGGKHPPGGERGAVKPQQPAKLQRLSASVTDLGVAHQMSEYLKKNRLGLTEFAGMAGTTDRTLRNFRSTGSIRRDIFKRIEEIIMPTQAEDINR